MANLYQGLVNSAYNNFNDLVNFNLVHNNPNFAVALQALLQLTGAGWNELPPIMRLMLSMFIPSLMEQLPGTMRMASLAGGVLSAVNSSQAFLGYTPLRRVDISLNLIGQLNSLAFNNNTGFYNRDLMGGMSLTTFSQASGALISQLLKDNPGYKTSTVNLLAGEDGTIGNWLDALTNLGKNADKFVGEGLMTSSLRKYYEAVSKAHDAVLIEAALAMDNVSVEEYRKASDERKALLKAAALAHFDLKSESEQVKSLREATNRWEENGQAGKGSEYQDLGYDDPGKLSALRAIYSGGSINFEAFDTNSARKIQSKLREALPLFGRNIAELADIFLTDDFSALLQAVDELHWGALANTEDVENIRQNLGLAYAMAAATNRDVLSVLTERKELAKFASTTSGGSLFVSDSHIANLQTIRQQAAYYGYDQVKSQDDVVADAERSYQDTKALTSGLAAALGYMEANPELFSDVQRNEIILAKELMTALLNAGNTSGAAALNSKYVRLMQDKYGFNERQLALMGKEGVAAFDEPANAAGVSNHYDAVLLRMDWSESEKSAAGALMEIGVSGLLGTSHTYWSQFTSALKEGGSREDIIKKLLELFGLGESHLDELGLLVDAGLAALASGSGSTAGRALSHVGLWLNGGTTLEAAAGINKIREAEAYANNLIYSGMSMSSGGGFVENIITGLLSSGTGLDAKGFAEASMMEKKVGGKSAAQAMQEAIADPDRLAGSTYFGDMDIKTRKVDEKFKENFKKYAELQGWDADAFFSGKDKNILNLQMMDLAMKGSVTITSSGLVILLSNEAKENLAKELKMLEGYLDIDMVSFMKSSGGLVTAENMKQLGLTWDEAHKKLIGGELFGGTDYADKEKALEGVNKFLKKTVDAENGTTRGQMLADRQKLNPDVQQQAMRFLTTIIGHLESLVGFVKKMTTDNIMLAQPTQST